MAVGSIEVATPRCLTKVADLEGWRRKGPLEYRISARPKWTGRGVGEALAASDAVLARETGLDRAKQEVVERSRSAVERDVRSLSQAASLRLLAREKA